MKVVFIYGQVRLLLLSLLALFLFYSPKGSSESPQQFEISESPASGKLSSKNPETSTKPQQIALKTMGGAFEASLRSMETVDFILIPALQTQEALSDLSKFHHGDAKQVVRFDTDILQESTVLGEPRAMLFARYWVSANSYRISILWTEPHGRSLNYPIYPTGLTICSETNVFKVQNYLDFKKNTNYAKPLPPRDVFRHMYGTYPVEEIRFAESENAGSNLDTSLFVRKTNDANQLKSKIIYKKERPIIVGFHGSGIKVIEGQKTNQFRELPMIREKGGRTYLVEYQTKSLNLTGDGELLPISIEVRNSENHILLRSAKLRNFQRADLDDESTTTVNQQHSSTLVQSLQDQQHLLDKAWYTGIENLSPKELIRLKDLRKFFQGISDGCSTGERLQKYAMLISLNRMLSDELQLKNAYIAYLDLLKSLDLPDFILAGGYDEIKGSVLWGRFPEANELTEIWLNAVNQIEDKGYIQEFASDCLRKRDFWMAARLLANDSRTNQTFETASLKYVAFIGTSNLLANGKPPINRHGTNEILWINSSLGTNHLNDLIQEARVKAIEKYNGIKKPTDIDKNLLKRVNGPPEKAFGHAAN